ncbi:holin [Pseudomonas phage vB_PaeM_USP_18]|nr:holin [Pseudomonas phage vB_PaeM_USP_18]QLI49519.1 holin [Pseudomonas phage vB_PaeM_USP_25]
MADKGAEIAIEVAGASVANKATAVGAATGIAGWVAQVNWIGLSGVLIAILGLLVNFYFQHRRDKREAAESAARIEAIQGRCDV